jgi:hypothetical protein
MASDNGKQLGAIYTAMQQFFDARYKNYTQSAGWATYTPDPILTRDALPQLVDTAKVAYATVLPNKQKQEMARTYEYSNFLLAMGRDHINAVKSRIDRCVEQAQYLKNAMATGDGKKTLDGMLLANVRKVNI